ncbi:MAG: PIN domain-containing protein [Methylococcaceae bacterium]
MFLSSEDISQRISNSSAPVLFIDTCIFLDILRSIFRDNIHVDAIAAALSLIKMSESDPTKVWLLTNETVHAEWGDNIVNVKQELKKEVKALERKREKLVIAANVILKIEHTYGQKMTLINLHGHLENLSRNLLSHCFITEQDYNHCAMGMQRSIKCLPPAKKGKSEPKDCVIFEAFLDVSEKVRKLGYRKEIYFVTSNSNDYGKANNPFIIEELKRIGATLIDNLPWALAVVEGRV